MSKIKRGKGTTRATTGNEFEIDQKVQRSFTEKTWDENHHQRQLDGLQNNGRIC